MLFVRFLFVLTVLAKAQDCQKRDYGNGGHVCVCTSTYCDTVPKPERVERPHYLTYTSNKDGLRFRKSEGTFTETNELFDNQIHVNTNDKYQEIYGWGGAFTDAAGININSLDVQAQDKLLESYFSETGIEYSLCRVPIGGNDFSTRAYSYADGPEDPKLANFQLAPEDFRYKIPFIKRAQNLSKGKLQLFASAWTAPKWMKTNNEYGGSGVLRTDMYQAWADYFVKFLEKYHDEGVHFWGLTTGNNAILTLFASTNISSVGWTPTMMAAWIQQNLGPTVRNSNYSEIKIMILDDQRVFLPWFVNIALEENTTRNYVDGIAVHWYWDPFSPASLLKKTHENFPEKFLLATEACQGDEPWQTHVILGSWERGERYAADIIEDVLNWVSGWVDWNMALDLTGGPTYISNFVDSAIIVNVTAAEFYKQPTFYALGHFSKFVPRGSKRVGASSFDNNVPVAAFQRPDNGTVVVVLNKKNKVVPIALVDNSRGSTQIELSKKSITTFLYW